MRISGWTFLKTMGAVLAALALCSSPVRAQGAGENLYKTKCAVCHGLDGKGETPMGKAAKLMDLGSADVQKQTDADLTAIIVNGKKTMPGFGKSLKAEQLKELVAYIRGFAKKH